LCIGCVHRFFEFHGTEGEEMKTTDDWRSNLREIATRRKMIDESETNCWVGTDIHKWYREAMGFYVSTGDALLLLDDLSTQTQRVAILEEALEELIEATPNDGCGGYHWRDDAIVDVALSARTALQRSKELGT